MGTNANSDVDSSVKLVALTTSRNKFSYTGPKLVRFEMSRLQGQEAQFAKLEDKYRATKVQLGRTKMELRICRSQTKRMEEENRVKQLANEELGEKISERKVKVTFTQETAGRSKAEMTDLKNRYHDDQIQIARLEERLNACNAELERQKNPDNPEGVANIKKIILADRNEMRTLRQAILDAKENIAFDGRTLIKRTAEAEDLEKKLKEMNKEITKIKKEKETVLVATEETQTLKEEFRSKYNELLTERETFESKLKSIRARLGVTVSVRNVNRKLLNELKRADDNVRAAEAQIENRLSDAIRTRDVLLKSNNADTKLHSVEQHTNRLKQASRIQRAIATREGTRQVSGRVQGFEKPLRLTKILVVSRNGDAVPLSQQEHGNPRFFTKRLPKISQTPRAFTKSRPMSNPHTARASVPKERLSAPVDAPRAQARSQDSAASNISTVPESPVVHVLDELEDVDTQSESLRGSPF